MNDPVDEETFIGLPLTFNGEKVGVVIAASYEENNLHIEGIITKPVFGGGIFALGEPNAEG